MKKQPTDTTQLTSKPTCTGNLCTKCGVSFNVCLTELIPPSSISLELVARDCVFVTMEVDDMPDNYKRFLLYYYYATSVYQFHGSGNRIDLPLCLIWAIHKRFPVESVDVTNA